MKPISHSLVLTFLLSAMTAHGETFAEGLVSDDFSNADYAPLSPGDSDLGVQVLLDGDNQSSGTPIDFTIGLDLQYTDNAPSKPGNSQEGSALLSSYASLSWQPYLGMGWFADLGLTHEIYEYEDSGALDFQNTTPQIGLIRNLPGFEGGIFYIRYELQRLTAGSISDSDYSAQRIRAGYSTALISNDAHELIGGISASCDIDANPDDLERNEYSLELMYNYRINHRWSASLIGQTSIWDFDQNGREDNVHILGASLNYDINQSAAISAGIYWSNNDTNLPFAGVASDSWQGGLSFSLSHSF